ncbi:hypothetical protein CLV92_11147 [Kineococcus xinjiangensis]|uniref:Uncharacterized protein n=1 Tax=Kineococcus xinjiangensis TaxID=512762 RepID=A0A2S6IG47_9ACTN|nr:hypothetical protein [Kineococcus xinjiangensis]PPK93130.1 hypothetical protein CLV92_11147 [Kineococcus xinjiangensis]
MADDVQHPEDREIPYHYRPARSRHRWVDVLLQGSFALGGPAQGVSPRLPERGPRTPEEAASGFGEWDRVTAADGATFLVPHETAPGKA